MLLWLVAVDSSFAYHVDIVSASLRNFIWSMTSWRRGHTCQQHSTTTQPSRPSKARPVQRPQLFLHTTLLSRRGAVVHTAWFLFLEDLAIWLQGWSPPSKLPCLSKITCCPKHQHLFCFYSLSSSCFSCFEQGLCYVYVSESEACFLAERRTDLVAQDSDRTKVTPRYSQVLRTDKSRRRQSLKSSDASERVKEMQCLLLHYI